MLHVSEDATEESRNCAARPPPTEKAGMPKRDTRVGGEQTAQDKNVNSYECVRAARVSLLYASGNGEHAPHLVRTDGIGIIRRAEEVDVEHHGLSGARSTTHRRLRALKKTGLGAQSSHLFLAHSLCRHSSSSHLSQNGCAQGRLCYRHHRRFAQPARPPRRVCCTRTRSLVISCSQ